MWMLEGLKLLILGWFLGIASPLIIEKIKSYPRRALLVRAISSELDELQVQLTLAASSLGRRYGTFDKQFILWTQGILSQYQGIENQISAANLNLEELLRYDDTQLEACIQIQRDSREGVGLSLKTYSLPFANANMHELSLLRIDCQRLLLDIRSRIEMINQEVEVARQYHLMTFDSSITGERHEQVIQVIKTKYSDIQRMLIEVVNKIGLLKKQF